MASHPRTVERVQRAIAAANVSDGRGLEAARREFLTTIDGMVFGDDPDQGVIRGDRLLHKELRFAFEVPPDFRIRSEEHTSELQSLMRTSYAVYCLKKKNNQRPRADTS